jgi:outer membrane protein assembly factor BamB
MAASLNASYEHRPIGATAPAAERGGPPSRENAVSLAAWLVPGLAALAGAAALGVWLARDPAVDLVLHAPGMDGAPPGRAASDPVAIGAHFREGDGRPADLPGSWPRFRGPRADNRSRETMPLADRWDGDRPRILWEIDVGEGHAGAAIHRGRVYMLDYDEDARRDALRCLSLDDGREIWRREYDVEIRRNHGMSRTVPAVTDRHVVTLGPMGHAMGVDAESGALRWSLDLTREVGAEIPMWYTGQCPLIDGDEAVLAPAGPDALLVGVDLETGAIRWRTPNPHGLAMSHASIVPAVFDGERMFVYAALGGMVGVGADGARRGEILWFAPQWDRSVIAPSPIVFEDGRIFATAGYGGGSIVLRVRREDGVFRVETLDTLRASEGLASEQQTPILHDGHLFGILPNDAGPLRNQFVCVHPDDPRTFVWASGREHRFGLGPYLYADGKLYVLRDDGVLFMLRATSAGYEELGRRRLLDGHDAWGPMALAGGLLVLRDDTRMLCVDLR